MTRIDVPCVLVTLATPLIERPARKSLPSALTVEQAVSSFRDEPPPDPDSRQVLQQLAREIANRRFDYLCITPSGVEVVDRNAKLDELASERQVRTLEGLKTVRAVALEVQGYMSVGARIA